TYCFAWLSSQITPMPLKGICMKSPENSSRIYLPPSTEVMVAYPLLVIGGWPGAIHAFTSTIQLPAIAASCLCCSPGVAAFVIASMAALSSWPGRPRAMPALTIAALIRIKVDANLLNVILLSSKCNQRTSGNEPGPAAWAARFAYRLLTAKPITKTKPAEYAYCLPGTRVLLRPGLHH